MGKSWRQKHSFFHRQVAVHTILHLKNEDGEMITDYKVVQQAAVGSYEILFSKPGDQAPISDERLQ